MYHKGKLPLRSIWCCLQQSKHSLRNKPGHGQRCKISKTLERKIVKGCQQEFLNPCQIYLISLCFKNAHCDGSSLSSIINYSGASKPEWSLPVNMRNVGTSFRSLYFGLMRPNLSCLVSWMLLGWMLLDVSGGTRKLCGWYGALGTDDYLDTFKETVRESIASFFRNIRHTKLVQSV